MKKAVSVVLVLVLVLALGAVAHADFGIVVTKHPTDETRAVGETAYVPDCYGRRRVHNDADREESELGAERMGSLLQLPFKRGQRKHKLGVLPCQPICGPDLYGPDLYDSNLHHPDL